MQITESDARAQVALAIFNVVEQHADAIARDVAQSLDSMWQDPRYNGLDKTEIHDLSTDIDWIANTDRADDSGQPYTEPYIAIYRAMRGALGLPVEY